MHLRLCPKIVMLVTLLALSACSSPAIPQASNPPTPKPPASPTPPTPKPPASPTAQSPTRPPARPTPKPVATSQPTALAPTAVALAPTAVALAPTAVALAPTAAADPVPPSAIAHVSEVTAVVRNGGNVREVPVTGKVLDQVNANETVQLLQKNAIGTWYQLVTARNVTGWVSATLLRIDPAVAANIPVIEADSVVDAPSVPAASSAAPGGWKTHTIGQNTLQLPPTWQPLSLTKADLEQAAQALGTQNPAIAQLVRQLITSGMFEQIKFFALETSGPRTGSNISLLDTPRPPDVPADTILPLILEQVAHQLPNSKIISSDSKHQVNGLPAGRIVYDLTIKDTAGKAMILRGVQWYIVGAAEVYILTISGTPDDALITVADQIGQSFNTHDTAAGSATTETRRQIIHGGNMRKAPKVAASNVIGQVCPGDQVALLDRPASTGWSAVRIVVTAPDCDPKHVPAGTEGWVSSTLLGPLPQDGSASLPPSLPISKLVAFTHEATHISGLRPENWTIFDHQQGFQISSSPEAPDGFTGHVIMPSEYPADGAAGASRMTLESLKHNQADGPAPEIKEEHTTADGSSLLISISSVAQGSTQPVRITIYMRTTITPNGVLVAVAVVPAEVFPQEEALIRQMVDSLQVAN